MLAGIINTRTMYLKKVVFVSLLKNQSVINVNGGRRKNLIVDEMLLTRLSVTKLKHVSCYSFLKFKYYI